MKLYLKEIGWESRDCINWTYGSADEIRQDTCGCSKKRPFISGNDRGGKWDEMIMYSRGSQILQKSMSHVKILDARSAI
jgi:hypothetical protein